MESNIMCNVCSIHSFQLYHFSPDIKMARYLRSLLEVAFPPFLPATPMPVATVHFDNYQWPKIIKISVACEQQIDTLDKKGKNNYDYNTLFF